VPGSVLGKVGSQSSARRIEFSLRRTTAPHQSRKRRCARLRPITQTLPQERQVSRTQTIGGSLGLMPMGVDQRRGAHFVQASALLSETQFGGLEGKPLREGLMARL
jgi:hypothetical protein